MQFKEGDIVRLKTLFSTLEDPGRSRAWNIITDMPNGSLAQVLSVDGQKESMRLKFIAAPSIKSQRAPVCHGGLPYRQGYKFTSMLEAWEPAGITP